MPIASDVLIDYTNKRLYGESTFLSGSTFYTMRELYTYIMDLFGELVQLDDTVPFGSNTSELNYVIANGWYVQQALVKHLKGASMLTNGYNNAIRVLSFAAGGYVNAVAGDIGKAVVGGSTGDTGKLLDYDNTARKWWVRMDAADDLFDTNEAITITTGTGAGTTSGASVTGEELFGNVVTVGDVNNGSPYIEQNGAILASWWGTGNSGTGSKHIDVLVKVKEAGALINSGLIEVYNRNYGDTYSNASADLSAGGRVVAALATQADSAITLTSVQVAAYVDAAHGGTGATAHIAMTFGTYTADIDDSGVNENYVGRVDESSQSQSVVYQALQWMISKDRTSQTLNGVPAPLYQKANVAYTPNKAYPIAQMAGTTLILQQGCYPINVGSGSYIATDTSGVQHNPPNTMSVSVTGLVATDRVAVFKSLNGVVDKTQFTSHNTANTSGAGFFRLTTNIPKDTPQSGYIRVVDTSAGTEQRYQYASWSGDTFTLTGTLSVTYDNTDRAYVGYIDEQASGTSITKSGLQYVADRTVIVRVRNSSAGGNQIIPFEVAATITSTGLAVPASRNPDYVIGN